MGSLDGVFATVIPLRLIARFGASQRSTSARGRPLRAA